IISGKEAVANRFAGAEFQVWDFATGSLSFSPIPFSGGRPPMYRIRYDAFSPDGQTAVTVQTTDATDHKVLSQVLLLDAATGKQKLAPLELQGLVSHVEFSRDGEFIVAAGHGSIARVWNVSKGGELVGDFAHDGWVTTASFSPDSQYLLT